MIEQKLIKKANMTLGLVRETGEIGIRISLELDREGTSKMFETLLNKIKEEESDVTVELDTKNVS